MDKVLIPRIVCTPWVADVLHGKREFPTIKKEVAPDGFKSVFDAEIERRT